jgi:trehalose-6-phosphatase
MQMAKPVMNLYTEATDGSYIQTKESALVWHHQDADPGFGSAQAKELLDHLESVLANEPVSVKSGQFIVEVKPQVCSCTYIVKDLQGSVSIDCLVHYLDLRMHNRCCTCTCRTTASTFHFLTVDIMISFWIY